MNCCSKEISVRNCAWNCTATLDYIYPSTIVRSRESAIGIYRSTRLVYIPCDDCTNCRITRSNVYKYCVIYKASGPTDEQTSFYLIPVPNINVCYLLTGTLPGERKCKRHFTLYRNLI